ncbi:hypothetical protein C2G38_2154407 [Gigaspora rosea]|uniref:MD-2-related lipid-recognition domain-containing protein n=1 Tax=Gigaspora rosea TaxID=44941 RepID=A0A397W4X6_9GLOM|nr:hypothetical protein C2G38_2154407 [Gigaspora rosea]
MKELNFGIFALTLVTLFAVFNTAYSADPIKFNQCTIDGHEPIHPIEVTVSPNPPVSVGNVFTVSGNFSFSLEDDGIEFIANEGFQGFSCAVLQCDLRNDSFNAKLKIDLADLGVTSRQDNLSVIINREEYNVKR